MQTVDLSSAYLLPFLLLRLLKSHRHMPRGHLANTTLTISTIGVHGEAVGQPSRSVGCGSELRTICHLWQYGLLNI